MADEKKSTPPPAEQEISRRNFFSRLGLGSLGVAAAGTLTFAYQFLSPNVLYEASPIVNAGTPDTYPVGSVTLDVNSANLSGSFAGRLLLAERHLYASWMHDSLEAGTWHHCLPMPWQQVQPGGTEARRSGAQTPAVAEDLAE